MPDIISKTIDSILKKGAPVEFSHEEFIERFGNTLYKGLKKTNYSEMYKRGYEMYANMAEFTGVSIEPKPIPPSELKLPVSFEQIEDLEVTLSCMFSGALVFAHKVFGRDPEEIKRASERHSKQTNI